MSAYFLTVLISWACASPLPTEAQSWGASGSNKSKQNSWYSPAKRISEPESYRNVFAELGYTQSEIDKRFNEILYDLFEGPRKIYFEVGDSLAYISDIKNKDVRTEGMSYGLMVAVQLDRKEMFDRLWRWARRYMQHRDGPMEGYFAWSCNIDGTRNSEGPASDGELYFVTALLFASNRWGNDTGINYKAEARYILDNALAKDGSNGVHSLINKDNHLITFTPTSFGASFTDPSYHLPAFYEVWASYADDGRQEFWNKCAAASRAYLHHAIDSVTGLNPDYSNYDGSKLQYHFTAERPRPKHFVPMDAFRYDSWRVPMNITLDFIWSGADSQWQREYANRTQSFFYGKGIDTFVDQYNVDGSTVQDTLRAGNYAKALRHSLGLIGTLAAASIASDNPHREEFVRHFWEAKHEPYFDGFFDEYYDGLLQLFAFMHLSGKYRIIHDRANNFEAYFKPVTTSTVSAPDNDGFIRRWRLAEPISKPNRSNILFTDSYIRKAFKDNQPTKNHKWYNLESTNYNVKLYRLATGMNQNPYGKVFWAETIVNCPSEMTNVRLAVGSNSASQWWVNGQESAILSGDRRMVMDDVVSPRLTLKKGTNILRGAIINGPGMSDFCVRFIDENGRPINNVTIE